MERNERERERERERGGGGKDRRTGLPDVFICKFFSRRYQVSQNFIHVHIELFSRRLFHHIEKEMTVFVVDETIVEHSVHLVHPQSDKLIAFLHARGWNQENSEYDTSKVTQVEHVVGLGGCGQEIVDGSFINLQCRQDYDLERKWNEMYMDRLRVTSSKF